MGRPKKDEVIPSQCEHWRGNLLAVGIRLSSRRLPHQPAGWFAMTRVMLALVCSAFLVLPVHAEETKYAALTFDDGPSGHYTIALLDGLYDRGVKATFLLCGYRMQQFPELTKRIYNYGHEIGYHGYSHRDLSTLSRRDMAEELMKTQNLLPEGCHPRFLRPPGGNVSDAVRQVAEARNLAILSWSVDPRDWATQDAAAIEGAVLETVKDGDIILLHDTSDSSVEAALEIVDTLHERGFELVTVSELAKLRGVRPQAGKIYKKFYKEG